MGGELVSSPSWTGPASTSLLGESRGLRDTMFRSRRGRAQQAFPRRVKQLPGNAPVERFAAERAEPRTRNAGVGGEKIAHPKRANGSLRHGLACDPVSHPQPHGGRDGTPDYRRFASGEPGKEGQARDCHSAQPASATPLAILPRIRGMGCRQGAVMRDAIHLRKMALESLRGREGLSFRRALRWTEFAIG